MRLFCELEKTDQGRYEVGKYQSPQFRKALEQPAFQNIIMQTIERTLEESRAHRDTRRSFEASSSPWSAPSLFLMLAQDRQILEDMKSRGAFEQAKAAQSIAAVSKLTSGNYDERYRQPLYAK